MTSPATIASPWWAREAADVAVEFATDIDAGLSATDAEAHLAEYGPNELEEEPRRPGWLMFLAQFANTMIVVLLIAAAITVVIGDLKDAIVITVIVVLNAVIGFVQEYRAEQAMAALRSMAAPTARVVREGTESTLPAAAVVPGDILVLEAGDVVPADARLLECPNLRVNESALTGESVPVDKTPEALDPAEGGMLADRRNMVFKGTAVVYGRARAVVVATGMATALGEIAGLLKAHQSPRTPLQIRLAVLGRWLAVAALAVCLLVFTVGVARGEDVRLMFLVAVSLAVAAIPEALPAVVTIALALGAQRMVKHHALIRKLPAVETLGSVTVICSDKTGTLTQGRMLVERVWTLDGEIRVAGNGYEPVGDLEGETEAVDVAHDAAFGRLIRTAVLCNDAALVTPAGPAEEWTVVGDPTEGALVALGGKAGLERDRYHRAHPRTAEIPFDSDRKLMTTVHRRREGPGGRVATKGAVESVLPRVTRVARAGEDPGITDELRSQVLAQADAYAVAGYRVLALAGRTDDVALESLDGAEHDLTLYGLVAMADPPRPESRAAVEACRSAGITPVMITGDHPATAEAIATRLGIADGRRVATGPSLAEDPEHLGEDVDLIGVYARTTPEQKLDIVRALKARGHIVAMTGDGVNDAPALRTADIGVAMGINGTEVAKEAADMVLTDDNFATIVTAVGEGRRVYDNIRRFVRYTLTSNSGEIWVMLLGPLLGLPLPLLPVQILWINLVTDGLPGLALGVEPAEQDVMRRPPRSPSESIFARGLWQHVLAVGLIMGSIPLALGVWAEAGGRPWQTMVFTSLALLQLGHAMAVRSEHEALWSLGLTSNRSLLGAVLMTVALQILVIYWEPAAELLGTEPLDAFELALVLAASTGVFWIVELEKAVGRRRSQA
ncbi:MAG: cation-translocating P-type ATPase [Acidimicrobiia bacterium]|jgi:P-type Ca2+ transporter type 2C